MSELSPVDPLRKIADAIDNGKLNSESPMIFEGEDIQSMLGVVNYDLSTRLRDCTNGTPSGTGDNGILLTFHRESVPLNEEDNLLADGIPDEAGAVYANPEIKNLLKNPELPIPEDVIEYIQLRVAATRLGIPKKSDYDLYKDLESKGKLGFGHPELGLIKPDAIVIATCVDGKWTEPMAVPYSDLGLSTNMQVLHYGSAAFEGMTAQIG